MRKPIYTPKPGSVAEKVLKYFRANPTARLRPSELERAVGLAVATGQFNTSLAPARRRGLLRHSEGVWSYQGGNHAEAQ